MRAQLDAVQNGAHRQGAAPGSGRSELGISEATLYNWKKRYAGMGVSELRRLK